MLEARNNVEENVFTTFYLRTKIVGRLFITRHPTIPYEVFAYADSEGSEKKIESRRVQTEQEGREFVENFLNLTVTRTIDNNDIGDIPPAAKSLLTSLRTKRNNAFKLNWKGTKIPRGAKLDNNPITWTQHGCVYTGELCGEIVGYYVRTKEWQGESKDEHEMIISTDGIVEAGSGQTVQQIRDFPLTISHD